MHLNTHAFEHSCFRALCILIRSPSPKSEGACLPMQVWPGDTTYTDNLITRYIAMHKVIRTFSKHMLII